MNSEIGNTLTNEIENFKYIRVINELFYTSFTNVKYKFTKLTIPTDLLEMVTKVLLQ